MNKISLPPDKGLYHKIEKPVIKGRKYLVSTKVEGIEGELFSAYFGVGVPFDKVRVKDTKIRWLNDFSQTQQNVNLIFKATSDKIIIFYRLNWHTPVKSNCKFKILPISKVSIEEIDPKTDENFDDVNNFNIPRTFEMSQEQESALERNLVWIFASPRSGTTWLSNKLLSKIISLDEPRIGDHLKILSDGDSKNFERDDYFFNNKFKKTWIKFVRKMILNRIYSQIRSTNYKILIKEPNGSLGANTILECLPNSKLLFISRDGRDVVNSLVSAFSEGGWVAKRAGTRLSSSDKIEFIKEQSRRWRMMIKVILDTYEKKQEELRLMIKYEDLRNNTFETMKQIYKFLDMPFNENDVKKTIEKQSYENIPNELKGEKKAIRKASPGSWQNNFDQDEKQAMNEIMEETLRTLGYLTN